MIFVLIPLLTFVGVFVYLGNRWSFENTRLLVLRSAQVFTLYLVLLMEFLSLFRAVRRPLLILAWVVPLGFLALWARSRRQAGRSLRLPAARLPAGWAEWAFLAVTALVLGITAMVAWLAPPQTWDSLTYHMSRVAHWAQNGSVGHYATGIDRQASISPGAELITLNFYVLSASDRLATFTQWFAMLGSLVAVSLIAKLIGARPRGQWLAVIFTVTLPIGIVESSSTINDYVVGFWVVCAVVEVLQYRRSDDARAIIFCMLAVSLAMLTKPIAVPYLAPFLGWMGLLVIRRRGAIGALKWAGAAVIVLGVTNGGYLTRNVITYGAISNPIDFANHANQLRTPAGVVSLLIKNAGLEAGLPKSFGANPTLNKIVIKAHLMLGLDVNDPRTTGDGEFSIGPPSTQEDRTSSPYHFYLGIATILTAAVFWKRVGKDVLLYSVLTALTLVMFSLVFKWHIFSVRYHLPFFLLLAPAVGVVWSGFGLVSLEYAFALGLLVGARPWLLSVDSRPLVPVEGQSTVGSILAVPREKLYFANAPGLFDVYQDTTGSILARNCGVVGIMLGGDDPEYLIWELMGAPRSDLQIEWIVRGRTDRYSTPGFAPCAVICHDCEEESIRGLDHVSRFGGLQLYTHD